MLPGHLIDDFWSEVARELSPKNPRQAADEISRYRQRLESQGAGDVVYHWGAVEVAKSIQRGGFKES